MAYWCIASAPLLAGTDIVRATNETLAILTAAEYGPFCNSFFIVDPGSSGFPLPSCAHRDVSPVPGDGIHHVVLIGAPLGSCT